MVKGVYTSDNMYHPDSLPKGMELKVTGKDKTWSTEYAWMCVPEGSDGDYIPVRDTQISAPENLPTFMRTSEQKKPFNVGVVDAFKP